MHLPAIVTKARPDGLCRQYFGLSARGPTDVAGHVRPLDLDSFSAITEKLSVIGRTARRRAGSLTCVSASSCREWAIQDSNTHQIQGEMRGCQQSAARNRAHLTPNWVLLTRWRRSCAGHCPMLRRPKPFDV